MTLVGAVVNTLLNYFLIGRLGIYGLAIATSVAAALQTVIFLCILRKRFRFLLYGKQLLAFLIRSTGQLSIIMLLWYGALCGVRRLLFFAPAAWGAWLTATWGTWLWIAPLTGCAALMLWYTRRTWGIKIRFLDSI